MKELADISGYSENYFHIIFKKEVGISPLKYSNLCKIDLAKQYLLSTHLSITEISHILGYDNLHYFSRLFKRIVGLTPSEYASLVSTNILINLSTGEVGPNQTLDAQTKVFDGTSWRDRDSNAPCYISDYIKRKFTDNAAIMYNRISK